VAGKPWTNTGKDAPYLFTMAKDKWYSTWAGTASTHRLDMDVAEVCRA
jgi:hypothetical protein